MNITIRQRENKKYQAIVSYKDNKGEWKQKSKGGFDKRKDASRWANEMSFELTKLERKGILSNTYTLSEVFDIFMEFKAQTHSENTVITYQTAINFFEQFKDVELNNIKSIDLLNYIKDQRLKTGYKYNDHINKLKVIFNFAMRKLQACEYNPCDLLYMDQTDTDTRLKFIDKDLYSEILNSMKNEKEKLLIRVLYETGMRIGEILGLYTQDVNNCLIEVKQQWNKSVKIITPKLKTKNSYRSIPISKDLFIDLKKATCDISGRIFYDISYDDIMLKLQKFNTSCHCFRHTRSTILVSSGIDITIVASIIGDTIETIFKTYVEVNKDNIENKYEKVRNLL